MLGTSGRAILRALIAGETDPERLAALATVGWKPPPPDRHAGLSETAARVLVAEIGTDMRRFPTAGISCRGPGLCPRLDTSAGKRHDAPRAFGTRRRGSRPP
jgi:transposase